MNKDLLQNEWQLLGEQIQIIAQRHRAPECESSPEHIQAAARIEGFLDALRGMSTAWEELVASLPSHGQPTEDD